MVGLDVALRLPGGEGHEEPSRLAVVYLLAAGVATLAVVALVVFARVATSPPELRRLTLLAVLLPSAFVLFIEVALYFIELDERVSEVGEHVVATAILATAAVPFSMHIFRAFSGLRGELAHRARRLQALHEVSTQVTGELALPGVLDVTVKGARQVVASDRAAVLMAPGTGRAVAVDPSAPGDAGVAEAQIVARVATTGQGEAGQDAGRHILAVPLRSAGRVVGALAVTRDSGPPFGAEDRLLLDMYALAASAALDNARRVEEARLLATAEERERIARDLHDELGQLLGFLTAKIQATAELVASGRSRLAGAELARLERATRELSHQAREAIWGLRTQVGTGRPLGEVLEDYVASVGTQTDPRVAFEGDPGAGGTLADPARYELVRIAQEALTNARRHARARKVAVRLDERDGCLDLSVADDGVGFMPEEVSAGFGLKTMAERARALGGRLHVESVPGSGTVVRVSVPLARERDDEGPPGG